MLVSTQSKTFAYADDLILLFASFPSLIKSIQFISQECSKLNLILNKKKSEIIIIGRRLGKNYTSPS
jgi:hypothetical protein